LLQDDGGTMDALEEKQVQCPYCGELIDILIDCSIPQQNYIEDCQVCCRPINVDVVVTHDGALTVVVTDENE